MGVPNPKPVASQYQEPDSQVSRDPREAYDATIPSNMIGTYARKSLVLTLDLILTTMVGVMVTTLVGATPQPIDVLPIFAMVAGLYISGQYDSYHPQDLSTTLGAYLITVGSTIGAVAVLVASGESRLNPRMLVLLSGITPALVFMWRMILRRIPLRAIESVPVLIIGAGSELDEASRVVREAPHLRVDDVIPSDEPDVWLAAFEEQRPHLSTRPLMVVIARGEHFTEAQATALVRLRRLGGDVMTVAQLIEEVEERIPVRLFRDDGLDSWTKIQQSGHLVSRRAKRVVDIIGAVLLALILGVPALLSAIATQLFDGAPALYRQPRVGRNGHLFNILKIRSMVVDAERSSGAVWSVDNDPRITRLGRWLRQSRLDEIPQLWNVIRGEMSLVGPRPERPEFTDSLARALPLYESRHIMKPGLTGWAQIRLPYGSSVDDAYRKLEFDLYYIRHWSIWFDLRILLKTIGVVVYRRGR